MKGALRIRAKGAAIRTPAMAAARSMVKIVLFRQNIFPSPNLAGLPAALGKNIMTKEERRSDGGHKQAHPGVTDITEGVSNLSKGIYRY